MRYLAGVGDYSQVSLQVRPLGDKAASVTILPVWELLFTPVSLDRCVTLLLAKGVPDRVITEVLGHAEIGVTMNTYANPRELHQTGAFALVVW